MLASLRKTFEQRSKLSWDEDVKPALGSELDLVALPGKKPQFVGLTQGGDQAKLDALLHKLDKGIVSEQIDGWTAFSSSQAALDTVKSATTKLADNNTYQAAVAKLAGDALVRAYANGTDAQQLLASLGKQSPPVSTPPFAWASADLVASGDGVRVNALLARRLDAAGHAPLPADSSVPYASSLVDEIPSGALLVADFPVTPGQFQFSDKGPLPKRAEDVPRRVARPSRRARPGARRRDRGLRPHGAPDSRGDDRDAADDTKVAEDSLADVLKTLRAPPLPRAASAWRTSPSTTTSSAAS